METEEVIKLVDGIYKNILEKFNPGARQLISAGKAYLKALHGAAAASRLFNEALAKIAVNAQQGGTTDIGSALINIVGVYKEIQDQQMNILKAFYVDLLVPLETNLEKDTKVVQFEQKKFLQQHKVRADSYSKAAATMKKQRKKKNNTTQASEKEIKSIQALDEEKNKLDMFCEQSLKNAMTQERRRYGFVLERQCSLAKHWMAYHSAGSKSIEDHLDGWGEVAATREFLPPNVENMFARKMREIINDDDSDRGSISSVLRKTKSIDASCLDMRSLGDVINSSAHIPRAKSEFNLNTSTPNEHTNWDQRPKARSLYAYLSSGENQLSFLEGDRIALVGDRAKGWQFGENLRTQMFGWFPLAYTEMETDENSESNWDPKVPTIMHTHISRNEHRGGSSTPDSSLEGTLVDDPIHNSTINSYHDDSSPTRLFGDTIMYRQSKQFRHVSGGGMNNGNGGVPKPGPPPTLPAPVPTPVVPNYTKNHHLSQSHSFSSAGGPPIVEKRKSGAATTNFTKQVGANKHKTGRNGVTNASLHSSNDSGFANEPPPQPEVDYSDEETVSRVPIRNSRKEKKTMSVQNLSHHVSRSSQRFSKAESPERHAQDDEIKELRESANRHSYNQKMGTLGNNNSRANGSTNQNIRQSTSFGNLTDENTIDFLLQGPERRGNLIKRTKSFWRFGKGDDILEGMALWKHRDLVQLESEKNEQEKLIEKTKIVNGDKNGNGTDKQSKRKHRLENSETAQIIGDSNNNNNNSVEGQLNGSKYHLTKTEIDQRINKHNENIYGIPQNGVKKSPQSREMNGNGHPKDESNRKSFRKSYNEADSDQEDEEPQRTKKYQNNSNNKNNKLKYYNSQEIMENQKMLADDDLSIANHELMQDMNFFDDDSVNNLMLKTVKRQEILKQYYSSGTDTERHSSSSDPYDCIVVDDHLVRKENERRNDTNRRSKDQHNIRERDSHKMEFTTFRGNDELSMKEKTSTISTKIETPRSGTLLPRTKLAKTSSVGPIMQTVMKMDKEQHDARDNDTTQRRTKRSHAASNNTNVNNGKAYGPWYDLWGRDASVQN